MYINFSLAYVFVSLIELTLINYLWRRQRVKMAQKWPQTRSSTTTSFITGPAAAAAAANVSKAAEEPLNPGSGGVEVKNSWST